MTRAAVVLPVPVAVDDYGFPDFWGAVTDCLCPVCRAGWLRWHEAGTVPGYRRCDGCGRDFIACGNAEAPGVELVRRADR